MKFFHPLLLLPLFLLLAACGPDEAKFDEFVANGQSLLRTGDWQGACDNLEKAVRLQPADGRLQYNYGMALLQCDRPRAAAKAFQRAASQLTGDEAVDALLGLARVRADQRRWDDAEDALEAARTCAPEYREADILAAISGLRYRQKSWESARNHAADALDRRFDHPVALYNLGCVLLYHDGDLPAARRAFDRYYAVLGASSDPAAEGLADPRNDVLMGVAAGPRASTAERIRQSAAAATPTEAAELARLAVREDPLDGEAWRNYAEACLRNGRPEEARKAYQRFFRLSPNSPAMASVPEDYRVGSPATFLEKAALARGNRNPSAAETQYKLALQTDPECFEAYVGLEALCCDRQDYLGALTYARFADSLRPNQPDLLYRIGCYLAFYPEHAREAVPYYRRFLQYGDPSSPQADQIRAWLRQFESVQQP